MLEDGPSKLPGRSQEIPGNRRPQMNDRYPVWGNPDREQNSAYGLLQPIISDFDISVQTLNCLTTQPFDAIYIYKR